MSAVSIENPDRSIPLEKEIISEFQRCTRCVLDTTVPGIKFNERGQCNFCDFYDNLAKRTVLRDPEILNREYDELVEHIKSAGVGKQFDCVLGVSGGLDSTYLALLSKKLGLRPLLVHFDNGWNSELAVKNIENIVNKLGFQLHTHVMDWDEFRDLQRAYFLASVVDVEVPTDQLIFAALYKIAHQYKIKFILAGNNVVSESINPDGWVYKSKLDLVNLKDIHSKYGKKKLKRLPRLGAFERYFYEAIVGIRMVNLLNLIPYKKAEVTKMVQDELGWRDYGGKHYESVFTRFYQGYYLPRKFNIDKRKAHLSNLILSNQITREQSLELLKQPPYPLQDQLADEVYVKKKLGFSDLEWSQIMSATPVSHKVFKSESSVANKLIYDAFRLIVFLPVRFLRLMGILDRPVKSNGGW
jgi:N-acetyl sugar amidotransferase